MTENEYILATDLRTIDCVSLILELHLIPAINPAISPHQHRKMVTWLSRWRAKTRKALGPCDPEEEDRP